MTTIATYSVTRMTCDHCVEAVTEELSALDGVSSVDIVVATDGPSAVTVTSDEPLALDDVTAAVDEAGYEIAGTT